MSQVRRLIRPTVDTPFSISLDWWQRNSQDFNSYLREALCADCRREFPANAPVTEADYIDPRTGEVRRLNAIWGCLVTRCSSDPDFLSPELPLASALFRALLANGNAPLSPVELQQAIRRSTPETILRVLTGPTAMLGIVPVT
ncbi:MAG: hypothetical protein U0822_11990 [Anaerolineae bacterium]